ncbi:MAG: hypothetical protein AAF415_10975 [Pseudomonadota bacterium]
MPRLSVLDMALALIVTALGAVLSYGLMGGVPLIGIDDAAITRSYAENIAGGHGYVYNIGGERVEGATSMLWTLVLTLAYMAGPPPEHLIIGICFAITVWAVMVTLSLTRALAALIGAPQRGAVLVASALLLALPGYFLWTIWTMMESALWSALLIWLVLALVRRIAGAKSLVGLGIIVPAALLPLTRPEGVAVAVGLLALAALLSRYCRRAALGGIALALISFGALTAFRMQYFGVPWPNTFYAKVSSDVVQGLVDGLKYMVGFLLQAPFAEVMVLLWAGAALWGLSRLGSNPIRGAALILPAAAVFGVLGTYAGLGGDHFALWRFYQPMTPLLPVAVALATVSLLPRLVSWADIGVASRVFVGAGCLAVIYGTAWIHFHQSRFDMKAEFTLVSRGLEFGKALNAVEPQPVVGVGPAGGIALAYDGTIRDLLGLNWAEMARANPIKIGKRNHASFDSEVFWRHQPDIVAAFERRCDTGEEAPLISLGSDYALRFDNQRFRDIYAPILLRTETGCWPGFAKRTWLESTQDTRLVEIDWARVQFMN